MRTRSIVLFAGMVAAALVQSALVADAVTYRERVLHSFNSDFESVPQSGVIDVEGTLYGTTINVVGTVYSLDLNKGLETTLASFYDTLYDPPIYANGILYGTTAGGYGDGRYDYNEGTVFSLDPSTGAEGAVYSFCSQANCADGAGPNGPLLLMLPTSRHVPRATGYLYGTTGAGGTPTHPLEACKTAPGCGTVFSLDPSTGAEKVLYSFCSQANCTDGWAPVGGLTSVNGTLYGTTRFGPVAGCFGGDGCGTVFSLVPFSRVEKTVYTFCTQPNCADGGSPFAGLIAVNGVLYGTTYEGGAANLGTVFSIDPTTGSETVLHSFAGGADGSEPTANLIYANGALYGTTSQGGGNGGGTVFSVDPNTGAEAVLYAFCSLPNCSDGSIPLGDVIYANRKLYGTTAFGGAFGNYGTVFVLEENQ